MIFPVTLAPKCFQPGLDALQFWFISFWSLSLTLMQQGAEPFIKKGRAPSADMRELAGCQTYSNPAPSSGCSRTWTTVFRVDVLPKRALRVDSSWTKKAACTGNSVSADKTQSAALNRPTNMSGETFPTHVYTGHSCMVPFLPALIPVPQCRFAGAQKVHPIQ